MSRFKVGDIVIFSHPDRLIENSVQGHWAKKICSIGKEYEISDIFYNDENAIRIKNKYYCNAGQFTLKSEYDMQNKTEIKRIPFDIERAKKGDKVVNGNGAAVRIICFDRASTENAYPICALHSENDHELLFAHDSHGLHVQCNEKYQLFMAPVEKTGWIALYHDTSIDHSYMMCTSIWKTEAEAIHAAKPEEVICTKQITWEE